MTDTDTIIDRLKNTVNIRLNHIHGQLIIFSGKPGSGKTTMAEYLFPNQGFLFSEADLKKHNFSRNIDLDIITNEHLIIVDEIQYLSEKTLFELLRQVRNRKKVLLICQDIQDWIDLFDVHFSKSQALIVEFKNLCGNRYDYQILDPEKLVANKYDTSHRHFRPSLNAV